MKDIDVERVERQLKLIRERVAGRRVSGSPTGELDAERLIDDAGRMARVNAHWGIAPSWPVGGRFEVLGKRAIRILLRWYVNPIVEQQNDFNAAVVRALYELESEVHALRADLRNASGGARETAGDDE